MSALIPYTSWSKPKHLLQRESVQEKPSLAVKNYSGILIQSNKKRRLFSWIIFLQMKKFSRGKRLWMFWKSDEVHFTSSCNQAIWKALKKATVTKFQQKQSQITLHIKWNFNKNCPKAFDCFRAFLCLHCCHVGALEEWGTGRFPEGTSGQKAAVPNAPAEPYVSHFCSPLWFSPALYSKITENWNLILLWLFLSVSSPLLILKTYFFQEGRLLLYSDLQRDLFLCYIKIKKQHGLNNPVKIR